MIDEWINTGLSDLHLLDLRASKISHLEPGTFITLTQLRYLSVIDSTFTGLVNVGELYLGQPHYTN